MASLSGISLKVTDAYLTDLASRDSANPPVAVARLACWTPQPTAAALRAQASSWATTTQQPTTAQAEVWTTVSDALLRYLPPVAGALQVTSPPGLTKYAQACREAIEGVWKLQLGRLQGTDERADGTRALSASQVAYVNRALNGLFMRVDLAADVAAPAAAMTALDAALRDGVRTAAPFTGALNATGMFTDATLAALIAMMAPYIQLRKLLAFAEARDASFYDRRVARWILYRSAADALQAVSNLTVVGGAGAPAASVASLRLSAQQIGGALDTQFSDDASPAKVLTFYGKASRASKEARDSAAGLQTVSVEAGTRQARIRALLQNAAAAEAEARHARVATLCWVAALVTVVATAGALLVLDAGGALLLGFAATALGAGALLLGVALALRARRTRRVLY